MLNGDRLDKFLKRAKKTKKEYQFHHKHTGEVIEFIREGLQG